ncbi:MAG: DEAD/DEAH box helicase family protein [Verrucomicrobiaceae bacterium]|nr:DEAD/DEAH box helicase family protein [Verrucomicrobiaceae bacterium]
MEQPFPGQRWVSDTEPELGIGVVGKAEFGRVQIFYPAAQQSRQYALSAAPLRRVRFQAGDTVRTHDGRSLNVTSVEERSNILFYLSEDGEISEAELADTITFSKPEDRLKAGQIDDLHAYDLRVEALRRRAEIRQSPVRGFCGGRVDLLPHQLYIAGEVAARLMPRVLLADEVGLGKTIEACLILHRLHLTGRAERVLILVPEALVNQWFVELFRRFHLTFSIFDEERCEAMEANAEIGNPFLESQLILASTRFLAGSPARTQQVLEAGFDLLVVDEAHHLEWSALQASAEYQLVDQLAQKVPGLLLLTATPQQLGPEGHFARLRLLDPGRYADLQQFLDETGHYEEVARAVDRLVSGKSLTASDEKLFARNSARIHELLAAMKSGVEGAREQLITALLDEFGTGRVMFRNTRAALTGFPAREARLAPLDGGNDPLEAKVKWLAALLKELGDQKVLLICRSRELAGEIHERLLREVHINAAQFHEGLTMLQRDRHAAFFADEEGARVLLCSEIGSEGRNFQFAHHLVLFDLPRDPELLEQRIGRLDRIGQTSTIHIHVPYFLKTEEEVLARWYHEGLNAFEKNLHGATEIAQGLQSGLEPLLAAFDEPALAVFLAETRALRQQVTKKLERGHDRLLELNSCKPERAAGIIDAIRVQDDSAEFEAFFIRLVDHFGLHVEDHAPRTYFLKPEDIKTDRFPALPEDGTTVTFDRARALSRENIGFLTPDHPLVRGVLDLMLGSEDGNSNFAVCKHPKSECLFLETYFIVECVAPAALHVDRFLAPAPLRMIVDHTQVDRRQNDPLVGVKLEKSKPTGLFEKSAIRNKLFPAMLAKSRKYAEEELATMVSAAKEEAARQIQAEIDRLEDLRQRNDHVHPAEIESLREHLHQIESALDTACLRLDCLRLVFQTKAK